MRKYTIRGDECCNTLTTVQKDNYILAKKRKLVETVVLKNNGNITLKSFNNKTDKKCMLN